MCLSIQRVRSGPSSAVDGSSSSAVYNQTPADLIGWDGNNQEVYVTVVADYNGGTPQFNSVASSAGAIGTRAAVDGDAIDNALGHSDWARISDIYVVRNSDGGLIEGVQNYEGQLNFEAAVLNSPLHTSEDSFNG